DGGAPNHVEGDGRVNLRAIRQGVGQIEVIFDREVLDVHLRPSRPEVDLNVAVRNGQGPKGAAVAGHGRAEAGVEIMNLGRVFGKVKLSLIDVESDEGEGAVVNVSIHPLVDAPDEAHVGVPEEEVAVVVRARALDMSNSDEAVEIADGAGVAADLVRRRRVG